MAPKLPPLVALLLAATALVSAQSADPSDTVLHFTPSDGDATLMVRQALEEVTTRNVTLTFAEGRYDFHGEFAFEQYRAITNHNNGLKRIIFAMDRFDAVIIKGENAEFMFHDQVLPFMFDGCDSVELSGITVDWEKPYYFQGRVDEVNEEEGWFLLTPDDAGSPWSVKHGRLSFPDLHGVSYDDPGETLSFDAEHRRVFHGAWDFHLAPDRVEQQPDGRLLVHAKPRRFPIEGSMLVAKGGIAENRYAPAVWGINSRNIQVRDVTVHHAVGMGFLFERCDTITLSDCGIYVRPGSDRMVSAMADATHFCNCRGEILVENSRFQHMLDDGTNVHGTYVEVDEVLNAREVRVELKHFQQHGFQFAGTGDEVWIIQAPEPGRGPVKTVADYRPLNEQYAIVTFAEELGESLQPGDVLENKTWNPSFTMRGCTITDHRARNIVLKTPGPILIEENHFSSMMSSVFLRGETFHWFESGNVEDVLIRNNRFEYCAYSGAEHAVLMVSPRLGKAFDSSRPYDRNIRFHNNDIHTFGTRIVWAFQVEGLEVTDNTIVQTPGPRILHPDAPTMEFIHCTNVRMEGNSYTGNRPAVIAPDASSEASLTLSNNPGF